MVHERIYSISLDKASPGRLTNSLCWKAHMSVGARQRDCSTMAVMWSHGCGGRVNLCSRVLELDLEAGICPGRGLHWYCMTGLCTTNWVIACSLNYKRNLACGEGTRLDYCDVISAARELGMAIITLGELYFVFSCRVAPTDAVIVQH
jgi:hypothetical protein